MCAQEVGSIIGKKGDIVKKFREEGGFSRLGDKYLPEEKKAFAKEGIRFSFE